MKVENGVTNFAVYEDATEYYGMAEVTLPEIASLTEEDIHGINDTVDQPPGHFLVNLAPIGQDKGVRNPAEHTGNANEIILYDISLSAGRSSSLGSGFFMLPYRRRAEWG